MEDRIIANVIYKELFSYSAVLLPQIGYVSFVDAPATLSPDGNSLIPPYRMIAAYRFDEPVAPYTHIVNAISQVMSVDPQAAADVYDSYVRRNTNENNILTIPYVMRIDLNDMSVPSIDERLKAVLDAQDQAPMVLREAPVPIPGRSQSVKVPYALSKAPAMWQVVFSAIALSVAVMFLVYRFFLIDLI